MIRYSCYNFIVGFNQKAAHGLNQVNNYQALQQAAVYETIAFFNLIGSLHFTPSLFLTGARLLCMRGI